MFLPEKNNLGMEQEMLWGVLKLTIKEEASPTLQQAKCIILRANRKRKSKVALY